MGIEESVSSAGNYLVYVIFAIVGFFLMLAFLSYIPPDLPSGNPYNGWVWIIIIIAYVFFLYFGYRKAKDGSLLSGLTNG
jgi:Ca2+/H+ antiporter